MAFDIEDANKALSGYDMKVSVASNGNLQVGFENLRSFGHQNDPETGLRVMSRDEAIMRAQLAAADALRASGAQSVSISNTRRVTHAGEVFFVHSPNMWVNNNAPTSAVGNSAAVSKLEARLARTEAALAKSMALLEQFAGESDESEIPI
jgi:hypothetical protein